MSPTQWRRANVLAVDDQRANLLTLEAVLAADYNVIPANSGYEAISILESRDDIDVILMDAQMPGMDGFETAARIKRMAGCQDIPIAFITAVYNEDPFIKQGYKVGGVDYFSKPFDPEILRVKVGIFASFRQKADILKERARQLEESEELLRAGRRLWALLEHLEVGVIVTDTRGCLRHVTPRVHALSESLSPSHRGPPGTILGWWNADGQLVDDLPTPLARALSEGRTDHESSLEVRCSEGLPRSILCSASPLRDLDGEPAGAILILHDVTERRQVERDLERRIQRFVSAGAELAPG